MPRFGARRTLDVWRGLRPCTPDGLPVIGRVRGIENAVLATGHGMWGLQLAPVTGRLVAAMVADERPDLECTRSARSLPVVARSQTGAPLDTLRDVEVAA